MFIAINCIQVPKGQGENLEKRFAASEGLKGQSGVLGFELLRRTWQRGADAADEMEEYLAVTRWETEEQFHAWTKSDAFKKAHGHKAHADGAAHGEGAHACASKSAEKAEGTQGAACNRTGKMNAKASGYTVVIAKEPQLV